MKQIRSQPLRCPLCERGRIIDAGPMASVSQFTLYGPQYVQHAQLIAKCEGAESFADSHLAGIFGSGGTDSKNRGVAGYLRKAQGDD